MLVEDLVAVDHGADHVVPVDGWTASSQRDECAGLRCEPEPVRILEQVQRLLPERVA